MSLAPGTRIGPYEIIAPLGAGGMGEVYRARDAKLQRDVAMKVLPEAVAADSERLARFEREAQALAALNHPNIGAVYAVEGHAIVMELVAGEDLSARISRGPISLADALPLARQLTDALSAAHDAGIVHRDLKPANIKVRDDGTVKVLDFGLAKALAPEGTSGTDNLNSPTLTARATRMGIILGTAAYMAPEQARGKAVDKRADIWAFGVVLYEMLTGTRPFAGDDITDVLAAVVRSDPDWTALPATTPPLVRRLLVRCLTKDAKHRLHDIADARLDIDDALAARRDDEAGASAVGQNASAWSPRRTVGIALAAFLLGGLAIGTVVWRVRPAASAPTTAYLALDVLPAEEMNSGSAGNFIVPAGGVRTALTWSPDGRSLAFVGRKGGVQQLYVRDLNSDAARPLAETEGAQNPTFSPDDRWLAYSIPGTIRKVPVLGGPSAKMCDFLGGPASNGITWGESLVVFAAARRLVAFSPSDATCVVRNVTDPAPEGVRHASPQLLPGDSAVLYTEHGKSWNSGDERVMVKRLPDGAPQELLTEAADARYLPTGHIAFLRQGTMFAVGFDADTLTVRGSPIALLKGVTQTVAASWAGDLSLAGQFAVSAHGALAYVASPLQWFPEVERVTVDRTGRVTPRGTPVRGLQGSSALSPNGTQMAVGITTGQETRLFLVDLSRSGALTLAGGSPKGEAMSPVWSKTNVIAFRAFEGGTSQLVLIRPDGSTPAEVVPDSATFSPSSWSPDGRRLVGTRSGDLWIFSRDDTPQLRAFTQTAEEGESNPAWSPDGDWIAYDSNATGRNEVYVRPYPGPGPATLVSTRGGIAPAWNSNGRELFYAEPNPAPSQPVRMMSVNMTVARSPGQSVALFSIAPDVRMTCNPTNCYAVADGGQQFLAVRMRPQPAPPVTHINLILNWFDEVKAKVPAGR
jgi:Tol biopolymer transport system component